jgi:Lambda phage tail tape-measure protein (Tape_meas_lam_C)
MRARRRPPESLLRTLPRFKPRKPKSSTTETVVQHYRDWDAAQGDWLNGAKKAFADYTDAGQNAAALAATAFTSGFNSINTSLISFVETGKLNWKSLTTSLIDDFVKFEATILESKALSYIADLLSGNMSVSASATLGQSAAAGATSALDSLFSGGLSATASAALGASASAGADSALASLLGFKNGGAFNVGGSGGTDSQIVAFKATPGERVQVGKAGGDTYSFNYSVNVTSPQVTKNDVLNAMQQTRTSTVATLQDMKRRGKF